MSRIPVLALDVDSTLSVSPAYWSSADLLVLPAPVGLDGVVYLPRFLPEALRGLHAAVTAEGGEVVWNTAWNDHAATWLAPRVGLPEGLRHLHHDRYAGISFGRSSKLFPIFAEFDAQTHRVAVLDDLVGGKDFGAFAERGWLVPDLNAHGSAYGRGVTPEIVDQVHRWLRDGA